MLHYRSYLRKIKYVTVKNVLEKGMDFNTRYPSLPGLKTREIPHPVRGVWSPRFPSNTITAGTVLEKVLKNVN